MPAGKARSCETGLRLRTHEIPRLRGRSPSPTPAPADHSLAAQSTAGNSPSEIEGSRAGRAVRGPDAGVAKTHAGWRTALFRARHALVGPRTGSRGGNTGRFSIAGAARHNPAGRALAPGPPSNFISRRRAAF